jgi:hypothetical protein
MYDKDGVKNSDHSFHVDGRLNGEDGGEQL